MFYFLLVGSSCCSTNNGRMHGPSGVKQQHGYATLEPQHNTIESCHCNRCRTRLQQQYMAVSAGRGRITLWKDDAALDITALH